MKFREIFEMTARRGTRASPYYRMTMHVGDPDGEAGFAQLKGEVRAHNKANPDSQKKIYTRGRLGDNNPAKDKMVSNGTDRDGNPRPPVRRYQSGLPTDNGGQWGRGWSNVDRGDAQRHDVYVRDKQPHEFGQGLKDEKARMQRWRDTYND